MEMHLFSSTKTQIVVRGILVVITCASYRLMFSFFCNSNTALTCPYQMCCWCNFSYQYWPWKDLFLMWFQWKWWGSKSTAVLCKRAFQSCRWNSSQINQVDIFWSCSLFSMKSRFMLLCLHSVGLGQQRDFYTKNTVTLTDTHLIWLNQTDEASNKL